MNSFNEHNFDPHKDAIEGVTDPWEVYSPKNAELTKLDQARLAVTQLRMAREARTLDDSSVPSGPLRDRQKLRGNE